LGQALVRRLLPLNPKKIIIYSRGEYLQYKMAGEFNNDKLRFFIGDVRDITRLKRALNGVDYVIHTAALKQVPACEYNPIEAVKTNIIGAVNVINASIDCGIKKVVALSTDKGVNPVNIYGATKLCSDKLFIDGNVYSENTKFAIVRYGNVANSRGSVIPYFNKLIAAGERILPITDVRMTRFYITIDQGIDLIFQAFESMQGGEIFVAKIPSFTIIQLVKFLKCDYKSIGIRDGEKLHEIMITSEDARFTREYDDCFVIYPKDRKVKGKKVPDGFTYSSDKNKDWLFQ